MLNIPNGLNQAQIDTYKLAYSLCKQKISEGMTITEAIDFVTERLCAFASKEGLQKFLLAETTIKTIPSTGVVAPEIGQSRWWDEVKDSSENEYSSRYYDYLRHINAFMLSLSGGLSAAKAWMEY